MTTAVMSRSRAPSVARPALPNLSIDNAGPPALAPGPQTPSVNKLQPGNAMSLYQKCILIRERWRRVPGFQESFLDADAPFAPEPEENTATDPVSIVFTCLRLSPALCFLFNALDNDRKLDISRDARPLTTSACKRYTAHFLMAIKKELGWTDDQLFTVTQLHDTNTTGMVKVADCILELLSLLESQGQLLEPIELPEADQQQVMALDDRGKVVKEILESERAYVAALEILMDYKRQLVQGDILSQDTIHNIFLNLDALVDFQRRFQIGVEAHASQPPESQRFGHLFVSMEDAFGCYAPYCANFQGASELVEELKPDLMTLSHVLDPSYELPSQLIKPIQRICKLPLLMQQLVKTTDASHPHYQELEQGLESIKRVTDKINETKRKQENVMAVQELKERVEDWKDHQLEQFGPLLLENKFFVLKGDTEREYHVYLFDRIILCCKEASLNGKKGNKSNSILSGRKSAMKGKKPQLQLKGRIYVNNVIDVRHNPRVSAGQHMLQVSWRGDTGDEHFSIKCRTADTFQLWQRTISKAMEDRKRSSKASNPARRMQHLQSPHSHFPNTPISELGTPSLHSGSETGIPGNRSSRGSNYQASGRNVFDEEAAEYMDQIDNMQHARRGQATQSLPPGARERDSAYANSRPRAHTQDSTSDAINQWRNKTPTSAPGVPRGTSMSSNASDASSTQGYSGRTLTHTPSSEWGFSRSSTQDEDYHRSNIARNASQASLPSMPAHSNACKPSMRSRSASSPHVYQMPMSRTGSHTSTDYQPANMSSATLQSSTDASSAADDHRFSQSSLGSHRSSAESSQAYTSATSPTSSAPQLPYLGNRMTGDAVAVRIKIRVAKDAYVIAVLSSINYKDLHEKVAKKIRLCGEPSVDALNLRLKYEDEDGDRILISSDEDITLAFEGARISQHSGTAALTIFVD